MNDLRRSLATHSLSGFLDSLRVDLEEVDGDLIQVKVYEIDRDEPSAARVISNYETSGFDEDPDKVAHRIWTRVNLDVRDPGSSGSASRS